MPTANLDHARVRLEALRRRVRDMEIELKTDRCTTDTLSFGVTMYRPNEANNRLWTGPTKPPTKPSTRVVIGSSSSIRRDDIAQTGRFPWRTDQSLLDFSGTLPVSNHEQFESRGEPENLKRNTRSGHHRKAA